jgi:hypothetical protein
MAVVKSKHKYGDIVYIKNDPEQNGYFVVGIIGRPTGIYIELQLLGEIIEVCDFEVSEEKDALTMLGLDKKDTEDDG